MSPGVDAKFLLFLEYTDALEICRRAFAQGKVIFMDSGAGASVRAVQGIIGMGAESSPTAAPVAPPARV